MFVHIVLFLVIYVISNHFLNKIRNFPPSPFPALPIIGHLYLVKKSLHRSTANISNKYGSLLLLQFGYRRVLLVSSPSVAEECFTKNDIIFANRPRLLSGKLLGYNYRSLGWAPYGDYWRNIRKISSLEIFSSYRLQLLSSIRHEEVKLLIHRISNTKDDAVDVKSALNELMSNLLMRMIAGKRYFGENVANLEEARRFQAIVRDTCILIGTNSNMADFLPVLGLMVGGVKKKMAELHERRDRFVQELIDEHRKRTRSSSCNTSEPAEKNRSVIEVMLALQESEPECYDDEVIKSHVFTLLTAGTDTSAATSEWGMSLLLNNPEILKKAQKEIDNVVGHDRLIQESDISKLSYLNCIIKETMRMYPAAPLLVPHESSEECVVGGYRVPRGTMLLVNMWAIQNDPKIWEDPAKFKPERFEGIEGPVRDGFRLFPFGAGRRSCPGEGLAIRMVGLTLGSLLQCFKWDRVGREMVDMTEGHGLSMPKALPLMAKCTPRSHMSKLLSQV